MFRKASILLFLLFVPAVSFGNEDTSQEGKLDVKEIVLEHLGDSYGWHITDIGDKHINIPLPVIVHSKTDGWHVFSSSRIGHGNTYNGFYISREGKYEGKVVQRGPSGKEIRPLDLSITKNVAGLFVNCIVLLLVILPVASWYRRRNDNTPPRGFRAVVEMFIMSVHNDIIKPSVGEDYQRFSPYLLTVFFFIFLSNLMGLIPFFPGGVNLTGNIAITCVLAVCTFIAVNFFGTKEYWKEILWPDVPTWLKFPVPLMPVIELFGIFTKPFALMIRLFANIMAGHAVILGLLCVIFVTASMGPAISGGMTFISVVFSIFINLVELLVAYIQAYVFTLLSAIFIGMARVKHA